MKPYFLAGLALVATWVVLLSPPAAFADPPQEAELLKRIERLEKQIKRLENRVAELEKARPLGKEPATETEKKIVGNWTITDAGKKATTGKTVNAPTDLTMKADGRCAMLASGTVYGGKYQVTVIGSVTQLTHEDTGWVFRIASVTDTELVLECRAVVDGKAGGWVKVRYARKK
jgi:hypothetical protein